MKYSSTSSSSTNASLELLKKEASSLIEQAKEYRVEMEKLPPGDPAREIYNKMIRDLLDRSKRLSVAVTSSASTL